MRICQLCILLSVVLTSAIASDIKLHREKKNRSSAIKRIAFPRAKGESPAIDAPGNVNTNNNHGFEMTAVDEVKTNDKETESPTTTVPPSTFNSRLIGCDHFECLLSKYEVLKTSGGYVFTKATSNVFYKPSTKCGWLADPRFLCWLDEFDITVKGYGFNCVRKKYKKTPEFSTLHYNDVFQIGVPKNEIEGYTYEDLFGEYEYGDYDYGK